MGATDRAIERKSVAFDFKELDDEAGTFEGLASFFGNVDRVKEVVEPGAFKKTLQEQDDFAVFFDHEKIIGITTEIREAEKGLYVKGRISENTQAGSETLALMREKILKSMSFAYSVLRSDVKDGIRYLKELALFEVSVVGVPANPLAVILGVKSAVAYQDLGLADAGRGWDRAAAKSRVVRWAGGPDEKGIDWDKIRKAYMRYDPADAENLEAYELLIADVVGNDLQAVPRAIYAAAARLGTTDTSEGDAATIKAHLARYYAKLNREPPWTSGHLGLEELTAALIDEAAILIDAGVALDPDAGRALAQTEDSLTALKSLVTPSEDTLPADSEPRRKIEQIHNHYFANRS